MPITLAEAQKNTQDALQMGVIDEFRKNNFILDRIPFDDAVSPTGGGATLTYAYTRLLTQPTAAFRAINEEYQPAEVTKRRYTADLKVFGGSFQIDRVIASMGGIVSEVTLQMQQKIKAAQALFNDTVINGDSGVDEDAFDGLDKALTGSSTEITPSAAFALDSSTNVSSNWQAFLDALDEFLMPEWITIVGSWMVQIVGFGGAILAIYAWFAKPIQAVKTDVAEIKQDTGDIKGDVGDILCDRLTQAHDCHIGWGYCSQAEKVRLVAMHRRYRALGRNHLIDTYEEDLLDLPDEPTRK